MQAVDAGGAMKVLYAALFSAILLFSGSAGATETKIVVRAKAKDAKFIATSMGGALVIIKDSETGEVLAQGLTAGSTGNTNRIMIEPQRRGNPLADGSTAKFEATIDIDQPRLVTVEVFAPAAQRQAMTKNSAQLWLLPGKHVEGDGIVVEVPGFAVRILSPQSPDAIKMAAGRAAVAVQAAITMMCGCILNPGGMWDSAKYEIAAVVRHNGKVMGTVPLAYANKPSYFEGIVEVDKGGSYELTVYAYDPATGNTGLDKTTFTVY
jgi:hypothetical protein